MQHKTRITKLFTILEYGILFFGMLVLMYVFICTQKGKTANILGMNILHVVTGSMEPTIEEGAYVFVKKEDVKRLGEQDIIAYYTEDPEVYGKVVIHRIVGTNGDGTFITKGDANMREDNLNVREDQIIGKYQSEIWFLEWLASFTDMKKLMLILVVIPLFLVSTYEFSTVTRLFYKLKSEQYQAKIREKNLNMSEERVEQLKKKAIEEYLKQQENIEMLKAEQTEKADDANGEG